MLSTQNIFNEGCLYLDNVLEEKLTSFNWSMIDSEDFGLKDFQKLLLYVYSDHIRFMVDYNMGYIWTGKVWIRDDMSMFIERIHFNILKLITKACENANEVSSIKKWLKRQTIRSVLTSIKTLTALSSNISCYSHHFDQYDHLLTCQNGIIDLRSGELIPFNKELYLSQIVDIEYRMPDPGELAPFQSFFYQTFEGDVELISYVHRFLGSCLTGFNTDQIFTIFQGSGRNGKSIITSLLQSMMPQIVQNIQASTFTTGMKGSIRSDIARTYGYRIVIADETNPNAVLDEALVKQMTSGDVITARQLYQNEISFRPKFKMILSTNHLPQFRGKDLGIKRRLRVIPFNYTVPEDQINPKLNQELLSMKEPIFWWLVQGAIAWFSIGLGMCPAVLNATQRYVEESNSVAMYLQSCCQPSVKGFIKGKDFYDNYILWCKRSGYIPVSNRDFSFEITTSCKFQIEKKRNRDGVLYKGIEFYQ